MKRLLDLTFHNSFHSLGDLFYSEVEPVGLNNPVMVSSNDQAAELIGLDPAELQTENALLLFSGNATLPGLQPLAQDYAGHQFGQFNPFLGDGRALILGQVVGRNISWDLCLKGAGPTPYSRQGDGRAVLRSSIREYLCSEAMAGLGIPTTRALCITAGEDKVYRHGMEQVAMLLRLSPSHVRFGSFENYYFQSNEQAVKKLADHVITCHFPELSLESDPYPAFFQEVVQRTARLMAQWQSVGFAHGVMNTDNFSILGLTFDYGPFGFMDDYDPAYICNHSDHTGLYAFDQQPAVGLWNCNVLARALSSLVTNDELRTALKTYEVTYDSHYQKLMRAKLGLETEHEGDHGLIHDLLQLMTDKKMDYTRTFRELSATADHLNQSEIGKAWYTRYQQRLQTEAIPEAKKTKLMNMVNPKYILRNYLAENAIRKAEQGDYSEVNSLLQLLRLPFHEQVENERYADSVPDWGKELEVSCSS